LKTFKKSVLGIDVTHFIGKKELIIIDDCFDNDIVDADIDIDIDVDVDADVVIIAVVTDHVMGVLPLY
jgi:hypothetical protein